jgi:hypothetical protein
MGTGICVEIMALFLILFSFASAGTAGTADFQKLTDARSVTCWVEGQLIDDIVLNARGRLGFIYVDSELGGLMTSLQQNPIEGPREWLRMFGRDYASRSGRAMFALEVSASKPWTFDTSKLSVAGYSLEDGDVKTGVLSDPRREIPPGVSELPSGYVGHMSIFVPASLLKSGEEIEISYGEDAVKWKVPRRNK